MNFLYLLKIVILIFVISVCFLNLKHLRIFFLEFKKYIIPNLKYDKENKLFVIYMFCFFLFVFLIIIFIIATISLNLFIENGILGTPRFFFLKNDYINDVINIICSKKNQLILDNNKDFFIHNNKKINNSEFYSIYDLISLYKTKKFTYLYNTDNLSYIYYNYYTKENLNNLNFINHIKFDIIYITGSIKYIFIYILYFLIYILIPFIKLYLNIYITSNINVITFFIFSIIYFIIILYLLIKNYYFLSRYRIILMKTSILSILFTYLYIFIFISGLYNLLFFNLFGFIFSFDEYFILKNVSIGSLHHIYKQFGNYLLIIPCVIYVLFFPIIKKLYLHLILDRNKYSEVLSFRNQNTYYVRMLYDYYRLFLHKDIIIFFYFNYIIILYSLNFIYAGILYKSFNMNELIPFFYFFNVYFILYYIYNLIFIILNYYKKKINLHDINEVFEENNIKNDKYINKIYKYIKNEKKIEVIYYKKNNNNKNNENENENKNNENKHINAIPQKSIFNYILLFLKDTYNVIKIIFMQIIRIFDFIYIIKEIKNEYNNKNIYKIRFHFIFSIFSIISFIFLFIYSLFIRIILENVLLLIVNLFFIFYFLITCILNLFIFMFNYIYRTFLYFYSIYVIHLSKHNYIFFLYIYKYIYVINIFYNALKNTMKEFISEKIIIIKSKRNEHNKYIKISKKNLKYKKNKKYKLILHFFIIKFEFFLKKLILIIINIKNVLIFILSIFIKYLFYVLIEFTKLVLLNSTNLFYFFNYMFFVIYFECILEYFFLIFLDKIINNSIPIFITYHVDTFEKFNFFFDIFVKDFSNKKSSIRYETNFFYLIDVYLNTQKNFFIFLYDLITNLFSYVYDKYYAIDIKLKDHIYDLPIKSFFDYTGYIGRFESQKSTSRANRLYAKHLLYIMIILLIASLRILTEKLIIPVEDYTFPYILQYIRNYLKNKKEELIRNVLKNENNKNYENYDYNYIYKELFERLTIKVFNQIIDFFKKKKNAYLVMFPIYHIHFELGRLTIDFLKDFLKNLLDFILFILIPFLIYLYKETILLIKEYFLIREENSLLIRKEPKLITKVFTFIKQKFTFIFKVKKYILTIKILLMKYKLFKIIKLIIILPLKHLLMINTFIFHIHKNIIIFYTEFKVILKILMSPIILPIKLIKKLILINIKIIKIILILIKFLIKFLIKLLKKLIKNLIYTCIKINKIIEKCIKICKNFFFIRFVFYIINKIQQVFMIILSIFIILVSIYNLYFYLIEYRIINELCITYPIEIEKKDQNFIFFDHDTYEAFIWYNEKKERAWYKDFFYPDFFNFGEFTDLLHYWMNIDDDSSLIVYLNTIYYYFINLLNSEIYYDMTQNVYVIYYKLIKYFTNVIQNEIYFNYLNEIYLNDLKKSIYYFYKFIKNFFTNLNINTLYNIDKYQYITFKKIIFINVIFFLYFI
jgi:hypothetical protein